MMCALALYTFRYARRVPLANHFVMRGVLASHGYYVAFGTKPRIQEQSQSGILCGSIAESDSIVMRGEDASHDRSLYLQQYNR